ncbi:MAG: hypothetical protein E6H10_01250 [Bacteroidetes bacterium]|nr:MAG: hypothetical protein E6H10_01250 [Bacteroidota bacterium]
MKKLAILSFSLLSAACAWTQGCVAIRQVAGMTPDLLFNNIQPNDRLILNITNRYFEAPKTYRGDEYITDTLVRNKLYTLNISALKILSKGWSLLLSVPISANSRRNYADHGGLQMPKHTTRAYGLGDIRFTAYKWLLRPRVNLKGNIQVGLGIKLPTGDYRYQDYFYRKADSAVLAPVDQAIQLGDGGTGITGELSAFYALTKQVNVFVNGFYLLNPREQNGVSNLKGRNPTALEIQNNTTVISVPDQYSFRGGATFQFQRIFITASLRYEKVPVEDLIGGNKGFRRAASIASFEPGVSYVMERTIAFVYVGLPFKRNIVQNAENNTTPAGFADYLFSFGAQFKL